MVEKILNNTTPYGKIRASHEGSLHSSTLKYFRLIIHVCFLKRSDSCIKGKENHGYNSRICDKHMSIRHTVD